MLWTWRSYIWCAFLRFSFFFSFSNTTIHPMSFASYPSPTRPLYYPSPFTASHSLALAPLPLCTPNLSHLYTFLPPIMGGTGAGAQGWQMHEAWAFHDYDALIAERL